MFEKVAKSMEWHTGGNCLFLQTALTRKANVCCALSTSQCASNELVKEIVLVTNMSIVVITRHLMSDCWSLKKGKRIYRRRL